MDFTETPRVRELREKVSRFMDEHVLPAEPEYWEGFSAETIHSASTWRGSSPGSIARAWPNNGRGSSTFPVVG